MENFKDIVIEFNNYISDLKWTDAVKKFYADDVTSADNEGKPIAGKQILGDSVKQFIQNTSNISSKLLNLIISDGISASERQYTFKDKTGNYSYKQISVQRWEKDKIIQERHYYNF